MPLEQLTQDIRKQVDSQIAEFEREAQAQIRQIEADAAAELEKSRQAEEKRVARELKEFERALRHRRESELRRYQQARELDIIDQVFSRVEQEIADLQSNPSYCRMVEHLYREALLEYERERADAPVVWVAAQDRELAATLPVSKSHLQTQTGIRNGVVLISPDEKLRIDNTPAARLVRGRDFFLQMIKEELDC
ncbi:MAG: hypothetical protein GF398_08950 [Chitinivibrionales bacterium]|nr:hypothetical protein [Chitinivibrionales bacterium]